MRKVYVLGVGQTLFGRQPQFTAIDLGYQAVKAAVADAGIDIRDIQMAFGGNAVDPVSATPCQDLFARLGISRIPRYNLLNACATGISEMDLLYTNIAAGRCDVGIAVGMDSMTTAKSLQKGQLLAPTDLIGQLGWSVSACLAMVANRFMAEQGATLDDICYPAVKNHKNAAGNQYAMFRKPMTTEEIMKSPMISYPITVKQCCPFTDGAAAVILCSEEYARKHTTKLVEIKGSVLLSGEYTVLEKDITNQTILTECVQKLSEQSGIGPEDVQCVETHDAFSPEELQTYESMLLCKKGEAVARMREGWFDIDGRCAVNPSGGLEALGHPIAASGVRVVAEIALQLRGDATGHQVKDAKAGIAQMVGGALTNLGAPVASGMQMLVR